MAATFRVTTYELKDDASGFTGTSFTLQLRQDLAEHYFVLIDPQGAYDGATYSGPDKSVARVSEDPHGTGDLGTTASADELTLLRGSSTDTWVGTVTVVECLGDYDSGGFRLKTVAVETLGASATTGSASITGGAVWSDIDQVVPFGGLLGGGVGSALSSQSNWHTVCARFWPKDVSGTLTVEIARDLTSGNGAAEFCIYVVEFGSEWTVQRASTSGTNGGNGVNAAGEYDTATIASVTRDETWVWACGTTEDNGVGDSWNGVVFTLGNGVAQSATEAKIAVGLEFADQKDAEVYVLSHSDLAVDYRFGTDNGTGIPTASATGTMSVDAPAGSESYGSDGSAIDYTDGQRFVVFSNSMGGTGTQFPAVTCSARHTASGTVTWDRLGSGLPGAVWLQSVDLAGIAHITEQTINAAQASVVVSAVAASIEQSRQIEPAPASLAVSSPGASISRTIERPVSPASLSIAAPGATVARSRALAAAPVALVIAGAGATIAAQRVVTCSPAEVGATCPGGSIARTLTISAAPAIASTIASVTSVSLSRAVAAAPSAIALQGSVAAIEKARAIAQSPASLIVTGGASTIVQARKVTASPASLSLEAAGASIDGGRVLMASPAGLSIPAGGSTIGKARTVTAASPSVSLAAAGAEIARLRGLPAITPAVGLESTASVDRARPLEALSATTSVAAPGASLLRMRTLTAAPGTCTIGAVAPTVVQGKGLVAVAPDLLVEAGGVSVIRGRVLEAAPASIAMEAGASLTIERELGSEAPSLQLGAPVAAVARTRRLEALPPVAQLSPASSTLVRSRTLASAQAAIDLAVVPPDLRTGGFTVHAQAPQLAVSVSPVRLHRYNVLRAELTMVRGIEQALAVRRSLLHSVAVTSSLNHELATRQSVQHDGSISRIIHTETEV